MRPVELRTGYTNLTTFSKSYFQSREGGNHKLDSISTPHKLDILGTTHTQAQSSTITIHMSHRLKKKYEHPKIIKTIHETSLNF